MSTLQTGDLGEAIFGYLSARGSVTTLFGAGSSCRIYPDIAPASATVPFAVYGVGSEEVQAFDGPLGFWSSDVTVALVAATPVARDQALTALRNALSGYQGEMGPCDIQIFRLVRISKGWEAVDEGDEAGVFTADMTFEVRHTDVVPVI